jgi:hypothetical protein
MPNRDLTKETEAAHCAILHAIQQATTTSAQRQLFSARIADLQLELRILEIEDKFFMSPFKLTGPWRPTQSHHAIFHGCHQGKYKDYLEGIFYDVGSIRLVAALLLAVKLTAGVVRAITDLPPVARWRLATFLKNDPLPQEIENWSRKFEPNRMFYSRSLSPLTNSKLVNHGILLSDEKLPRLELTKFRSWNINRHARTSKKAKNQDSDAYSISGSLFTNQNSLRSSPDSESPLLLVNILNPEGHEDDRAQD